MDHSTTAGFAPGFGTPVWSPSLTPSSESEYIGALLGLFVLSIGFRGLVAAQGYLEAYLHLHSYPRPHSRSHGHPTSSVSHSNEQQQHQSSPPQLDPAHPEEEDEEKEAAHTQDSLLHQQHYNSIEPDATVLKFIDEKQSLPTDNTAPPPPPPPPPHAHHQGLLLQVPPAGQGAHHQQQQQHQQHRRSYANLNSSQPPLINNHNYHNSPFSAVEPPTSLLFPLPTAQPFVWQAELSRAFLATIVVAVGYMLMLVIMTYNSAYLAVILAGVFVGEVYFARWGRVRPIFPAPLRRGKVEGRDSFPLQYQHQQQQQQSAAAAFTTIPSAFTNNTHDSISRQHQQHRQGEPLTRKSTSSARSSTSSRGYSSTMMNHGLSADGAC